MFFLMTALFLLFSGLAYSVYRNGWFEISPTNNFDTAIKLFGLVVIVIAALLYVRSGHSGDPISRWFGL